jgi:hypothetical protein
MRETKIAYRNLVGELHWKSNFISQNGNRREMCLQNGKWEGAGFDMSCG